MTTVSKNSQGRWIAWCEYHQDGYQGTKRTADKWAGKHDAEFHQRVQP